MNANIKRVERVLRGIKSLGVLTMRIALMLLAGCTVHQNININIMSTKRKITTTYKSTFKQTHEENNGISQTVEGEAYSVRELLEKHAHGIMPPVGLTPLYDHEEPTHEDDTTLRNPELDLTDIDTIKQKISAVQKKQKRSKTSNPDRTSTGKSETIAAQHSGVAQSATHPIEETQGATEGSK